MHKVAQLILLLSVCGLVLSLEDTVSEEAPEEIHITPRQAPGPPNSFVKGCYFTNWAQYRSGRARFDLGTYPTGMCNVILFAFATFGNDFIATATDPQDLPSDWSAGTFASVTDLKNDDPSLKVLLSWGGYTFGNYPFARMASTPNNRQIFISSAIQMVREFNFDGIDIDWEYPGAAERETYVAFVRALRQAVEDEAASSGLPRLLISAAVPAGKAIIDAGFDIAAFARYYDYIFVMTYDFHGSWEAVTGNNAPLFSRLNQTDRTLNTAWAMNYWYSMGATKDQLVMGLPTYGRGWTLSDPNVNDVGSPGVASPPLPFTQTGGVGAYFELCDVITDGRADVRWNYEQQVPFFVDQSLWFSYDNIQSFIVKSIWAIEHGYAGGFVWALDFDDFNAQCPGNDHYYPLIQSMNTIFSEHQSGTATTTTSRTTTTTGRTTTTTGRTTTTTRRTTTTTRRTTTTSQSGGLFSCPQPNGIFADPTSCSSFFQCSNGEPHRFTCSPPLLFNSNVMNCDFPENVNCQVG